jgi:hypothetical protein
MERIIKRWWIALHKTSFRLYLSLTLIYLLAVGSITPTLFLFIQARHGFYPADFLLDFFAAHDYSIAIFSVLYVSIVIALLHLIQKPYHLLHGLLAYAILTTLRSITLLLIPLEAPTTIVLLKDPLVDRFFYDQIVITKDLFFSGHTSILFLLFLLMEQKILKVILLIACIGVAVLLLLQHAHYTIDILAAPLFSFVAYRLSQVSLKRFSYRDV